ncbi:pyridoxal phosphate-dependent aminotransferase [Sesbania bispinosa]|nr:pyridoxal phosphate-dependent aminotransferase [Sesbania bispinosa]
MHRLEDRRPNKRHRLEDCRPKKGHRLADYVDLRKGIDLKNYLSYQLKKEH